MRKAIRNLGFLFLFTTFWACEEENGAVQNLANSNQTTPNIQLEYSITCGWGSRADTLRISPDSIFFVQNAAGLPPRDTIIDTAFVSPQAWLNILYSSIDMNAFQQLSRNSGGLAYDGCDIQLWIEKDGQSHTILYEPMDTLKGLENFIFKLDSLWLRIGTLAPSTN